jgi:type IV pilus assembly protein PilF
MPSRSRAAPFLPLAVACAALAACAHGPSAKDRKTADIHHDLGVEALKGGRASEALREFELALKLDPEFAEAHRGRGLVLDLAFGRREDAEAAYRRALELRPSYPDVQNDLGQLLARSGRYEEAIAAFDAALEDTDYREPFVARCNKGQALHRMGRRAEGIAELRACVTYAPRYCKGRRELGRVYLDDGRTKEALEELAAYARTCERAPDAHLQLGLARMRAGDVPAARESFEQCVALGGDGVEAEECRRSLALLE